MSAVTGEWKPGHQPAVVDASFKDYIEVICTSAICCSSDEHRHMLQVDAVRDIRCLLG